MSFTRFHDDPCRIKKQLQQQTDQGRWILDVPGNGESPCFMLDPQIIPQKWGGNLWSNCIDVQSSLLGIDKRINRDCLEQDKYKKQQLYTYPIDYPICDNFLTTEQSRTIMPAWTARDLQQNHAYILQKNPQAHTEMPFKNYSSTRILEKDNFTQEFECIPLNNDEYTVSTHNFSNSKNSIGSKICTSDCKKM